ATERIVMFGYDREASVAGGYFCPSGDITVGRVCPETNRYGIFAVYVDP
ncbi:hypothetical protein LCGC14_3157350, partial [marine sediment metagenome]